MTGIIVLKRIYSIDDILYQLKVKGSGRVFGKNWGRYSSLIGLGILWLLIDFGVRVWLLIYSADKVSWSIWDLIKTFFVGTLFDLSVIPQGLLLVAIYLTLIPRKWFDTKIQRISILFIVWLSSVLMLFGGVSEFFFWQEFQNRFNFIAVDYLIYTTEVLKNIQESYPVFLIFAFIGIIAGGITWFFNKKLLSWDTEIRIGKRMLVLVGVVLVIPIAFFSFNGSYKNISTNSYNSQLAGNGLYELFSAFRNNELDYEQFYKTLPEEQVEKNMRALLTTPDAKMISGTPWDYTKQITGQTNGKKPNVVVITVESLSSDYLGVYGGTEGITPNLDRIAKESLWFSRVYATGTRTVRGLEAVSLSIPPTPGQSIVRRPNNQDLFTMGSVFRSQGYQTHFVYGGYGYFDNMNAFFEANGHSITDRTDIPSEEIMMENAWGVADEVIFNKTLQKLDQDYAEGKPSFNMVLTTSNHRPFTYPDGRIDIPSPGDRKGSVKYTDWAIGDFIEKARQKPWFKDTIFVIVADHQADSAGKTEVPILRYHIPLFIYAPELIPAKEVNTLMSQIDLAPTLMGLLNFSYPSRFLGYDVMKIQPDQGRIFISTYQSLGYVKGDRLVVLNPQKKVTTYQVNFETGEYKNLPEDPALSSEAISWYQGASRLYKDGRYKEIGKE